MILHDAQQVRAGIGLHTLQNDVIGIILLIGLSDVGVVDLPAAQLLLQHFHGVLRIHIDRVVDLHLQNEVSSAAQIKTEVDVIGHRREQALTGELVRNPKNAEHENQQYSENEPELPEKRLVHMKTDCHPERVLGAKDLCSPPPTLTSLHLPLSSPTSPRPWLLPPANCPAGRASESHRP